jgi:hypothetical protein
MQVGWKDYEDKYGFVTEYEQSKLGYVVAEGMMTFLKKAQEGMIGYLYLNGDVLTLKGNRTGSNQSQIEERVESLFTQLKMILLSLPVANVKTLKVISRKNQFVLTAFNFLGDTYQKSFERPRLLFSIPVRNFAVLIASSSIDFSGITVPVALYLNFSKHYFYFIEVRSAEALSAQVYGSVSFLRGDFLKSVVNSEFLGVEFNQSRRPVIGLIAKIVSDIFLVEGSEKLVISSPGFLYQEFAEAGLVNPSVSRHYTTDNIVEFIVKKPTASFGLITQKILSD